ncbi:MAG: phosphoribosylanthranilate isomerase [Bacteroidota bacterium]
MKIKICGLRQTENIKSLLPLQPDYLGFIFYEKSRRFAEGALNSQFIKSPRFAKSSSKGKTTKTPIKTGVFVNEELSEIKAVVEKYELNAVQLHGDESVEFCEKLKDENIQVIKVFSVHDEFDFNQTKKYDSVVDLFLFDTKGKERGGNGIAFNWEILKKYNGEKPFFLSGGIGPEDAAEIKKINHPKLYGVDINSRFEVEPGLKNIKTVELFFKKLKNT